MSNKIFSKKNLKKTYFGIFILLIIWIWAFLQLPDHKFHIYFLDVGQGDAIFIKTPQNHQILIDGGPQNKVIQELNQIIPFFDKNIDLLVLTHPHADHIQGLIEVLKRYQVEKVLITGVNYSNANYDEFLSEISTQNIQVFSAEQSSDFILGEVIFDVIYPFSNISGQDFENINNSSIAMIITYQDHKILLSGDLEKEGEQELIETDLNLKVDIIKAAHHGSKTASSLNFLKRLSVKKAIIQSGKDNRFGHPHSESIRNFYRSGITQIFRNDQEGRVEFTF
ncbi:ComEC/Rec2 family competence protein [Patescibacteria group bacterium]